MRFLFAHIVGFILGVVLATALILQINPQMAPGQDRQPQKRSPNAHGHPPPFNPQRRGP